MRNLLSGLILLFSTLLFSQEKHNPTVLDANYFYGSILNHNKDISHLITGHPEGVILSFNKQTYGFKDWEGLYNYPDYGASFVYQDLKNKHLGENYSVYAHFNFYFFNRHLKWRIGQGVALTTNPYDKETNFRNSAYGTRLLSSTYTMLNYDRPNIYKGFGLQAGFSIIHYSNANVKAPNTSTNTMAFNVGLTYNLDYEAIPEYQEKKSVKGFKEPIKYNISFSSGVNESDVINSGQFPFYIVSAYVDKRLNRKSAIHLGAEVFFSEFLQQHIRYTKVAFPNENTTGQEDYRRVGVFAGHELFINKTSVLSQVGYYVYYPFDFEGQMYLRVGLKRYLTKKIFALATLKSHGAKAEAAEFGIGIRL